LLPADEQKDKVQSKCDEAEDAEVLEVEVEVEVVE
jgi:hypothetical protein